MSERRALRAATDVDLGPAGAPHPIQRAHPVEVILFDMGGTLDGRGGWRDRFHRLFKEAGLLQFSHVQRGQAFDYAERRSHAAPEMRVAQLRPMLQNHVGWQLEHLAMQDASIGSVLVDRFVAETMDAVATNRRVLTTLVEQGFRLGLVSNACGNAAVLCEEFGYTPLLSAIVDSHCFGIAKPDPAIFRHALALLGTGPERAAFVGDSLDRDIEPARRLGMMTIWIAAGRPREPLQAALADVVVDSISDIPSRLQRLEVRQI
jgi:putative hydrolase of the HAD superfamily